MCVGVEIEILWIFLFRIKKINGEDCCINKLTHRWVGRLLVAFDYVAQFNQTKRFSFGPLHVIKQSFKNDFRQFRFPVLQRCDVEPSLFSKDP